MIVRVKLGTGRRVRRKGGRNRSVALASAALLIPASLMAYVLAFWSLASDMNVVSPSGVTGLFSHWQVSVAVAVILQLSAAVLNRYGRKGELEIPKVLRPRIAPFRSHLRGSLRRRAQSG